MRLDRILLKEKWVSDKQLEEALILQRLRGGRLEDHLLRLNLVDRQSLLCALTRQFGWPGVDPTSMDIPRSVVSLIPAKLAYEKLILPFAFDPTNNILRVACEDPREPGLAELVSAASGDRNVELFLALGSDLKCCIIAAYRGLDVPETMGGSENDSDESDGRADKLVGELFAPHSWIEDMNDQESSANTHDAVVYILDPTGVTHPELDRLLTAQGYSPTICRTVSELSVTCGAETPDYLLITCKGSPADVSDLICFLISKGIPINQSSSFLLCPESDAANLLSLLDEGVEDVHPLTGDFMPLLVKLNRIRSRRADLSKRLSKFQNTGTHGTLRDISVADLLQTLGTSKKSAQLSITARARQLTIVMLQGRIIFAECDDLHGDEAVYEALGWQEGIWNIDILDSDSLPNPNLNVSVESILLEGCRRMDESSKIEVEGPSFWSLE